MKILVTGGAGFIGSNLVEALLQREDVSLVRVLDNLSTGHKKNIKEFLTNPKFEFVTGDIRDIEDCIKACKNIDAISHQAALGSVPRSIADPLISHDVNVNGFINMLEAAKREHIKRFVYASSSSVYGTIQESPKVEERVGKVLSPYVATKMCNELYAEAFARSYGITLVGFRYFNVFGPKQDPMGPYAAVVPLFIKAALKNESPLINGDGSITRDFTPVENVVTININSLILPLPEGKHEVVNVACGQTTSLNELWGIIKETSGASVEATHGPIRNGDILYSLGDIAKAVKLLNYRPINDLHNSIINTIKWHLSSNNVSTIGMKGS